LAWFYNIHIRRISELKKRHVSFGLQVTRSTSSPIDLSEKKNGPKISSKG
jgi:hypothetical protein